LVKWYNFIYKWRKKTRFLTTRRKVREIAHHLGREVGVAIGLTAAVGVAHRALCKKTVVCF
jgi:hypothetical protein